MKTVKKALALILAVVMTMAITACGDTSWVYEYEGTKIPSGVYLAFLMDAYSEVSATEGIDTTKNIFSQTLEDGTKTADKMTQSAEDTVKKILYSKAGLEKLGVELNDDFYSTVDLQSNFYWSYFADSYNKNGVAQESYKNYSRLSSLVQEYFEKLYGEGGEKEIPVQDLVNYFGQNYVSFRVIEAPLSTANPTGDTTTTQPVNEAADTVVKTRIDGYVQELNGGADFEAVYTKEQSLNSTGEDASSTNSALPAISAFHKDDLVSNFSQEFADTVNGLATGKAAALEANGYYVLIYKYDTDASAESESFKSNRTGVMGKLKGDEYSDWLSTQVSTMDIKVNSSALSYYSPKKLDI